MPWLKRAHVASIEPVLQNGWTGRVLLTRAGSTVWANFEGLDGTSSTGAGAFAIPPGYRPSGPLNERGLLHDNAARLRRWYAIATFIVSGGDASGPLYGAASWRTTDTMPTGGS